MHWVGAGLVNKNKNQNPHETPQTLLLEVSSDAEASGANDFSHLFKSGLTHTLCDGQVVLRCFSFKCFS